MTKITRSPHCGNSPKNKSVEAFAVAMETGDAATLTMLLAEDAIWEDRNGTVLGASQIAEAAAAVPAPTSVRIDYAISHGKVGAANGRSMVGKRGQRFCHVVEFTSVKCLTISRIVSYSD